jgi:RNA 2',3'-cyclic 3'-phosphodiesterase
MPSGSTAPKAESPTARLFVALWPDADGRAQLAACRDRWRWPATARPVATDDLHATLHFIGSFPRERIAELRMGLAEVEAEAPILRPKGSGLWRGGIAVLTLQADLHLVALHERVGAALVASGVVLETRPFTPHVTLARRAVGAVAPGALPVFEWRAGAFALVESLGGGKPAYAIEATTRLR